ncbi:MAG: EAL domain-containing protein [Chromatiaceae bacterium]|nr:MAG: EAL domain-containing protein [Chromatiaceae bacterium]
MPLRYLTVLILLVFIALSSLLAYRLGLNAAANHVETSEARHLEALTQRLQDHAADMLARGDHMRLQQTLQSMSEGLDVNLAVILGAQGKILVGMDGQPVGEPWETLSPHPLNPARYPDLSIAALLEDTGRVGKVFISESRNALLAAFPINQVSDTPSLAAQAPSRGLMLVQLDLVPAKAVAQSNVRELVLQFIGYLALLAILGLIFFHWTVTKRVERLARATRQFAEGDLNTRSGVTGGDELADLGRTFDQMVTREEAVFNAKERAQVTLDSIGDAVVTTDADGRVDYLNPAAEALTGWPTLEARGKRPDEMFQLVNETSGATVRTPLQACLREGRNVGLANHIVMITRDGRTRAIEDSAAPIRDRQGNTIGAVLVFHDVTKPRQMARKLSWQATHDPLTGLFNRFEFERRLQVALKQTRELEAHHALLYMDLDQFKVVNDTCGHVAGDELLKQLAFTLLAKIRDSDTLARLGGDEFGVLLEHCPREKALEIANNLRQTVRQFRFVWQGRVFEVGISIGAVMLESTAEDMTAVLSAADMACFAAKERGRDRIHVYHPDDQELIQRHGEMEAVSRINQALAEHRFRLYVQPIVPVTDQQHPPHQEILLRMLDEEGRVVMPGAFIPAAERFGLMPAVDRWVVHHFFSQFAHVLKEDPRHASSSGGTLYAINLSGASLNDEQLPGFVIQQLERYQIPASRICFEITETAAIANLTRARLFMNELRQRGCRFALDDFGTGLSSFTYLKQLPVDYLKIDGSLVRDIARDPIDRSMVDAIARIGRVMGLHTIAEFVEDDAVLATLAELGVDFAQGYGIARPAPLSQATPLQGPPCQSPGPASSHHPYRNTMAQSGLPNSEV